jgi:hypothetical protein
MYTWAWTFVGKFVTVSLQFRITPTFFADFRRFATTYKSWTVGVVVDIRRK